MYFIEYVTLDEMQLPDYAGAKHYATMFQSRKLCATATVEPPREVVDSLAGHLGALWLPPSAALSFLVQIVLVCCGTCLHLQAFFKDKDKFPPEELCKYQTSDGKFAKL